MRSSPFGLDLIQRLGIDSLRAEITLFEGARAHAVADRRSEANVDDVEAVASMALRLRRSDFMQDFFKTREEEETEIEKLLGQLNREGSKKPGSKKKRGGAKP
jgi:magnesium chelatase subunit I